MKEVTKFKRNLLEVTTLITPGGMPASSAREARARADKEGHDDFQDVMTTNVINRVRRVEVFDFGTGRVGYLQKSSGTGTGRDG